MGPKSDVITYLSEARRAYESAVLLFESGDLRSAANRAYYASFYAVTAILLTHYVTVSKHSALVSMFRDMVKKGLIQPQDTARDLSKKFTKAYELREVSDYKLATKVTKKQVEECIKGAKEIIEFADRYCNERLPKLI